MKAPSSFCFGYLPAPTNTYTTVPGAGMGGGSSFTDIELQGGMSNEQKNSYANNMIVWICKSLVLMYCHLAKEQNILLMIFVKYLQTSGISRFPVEFHVFKRNFTFFKQNFTSLNNKFYSGKWYFQCSNNVANKNMLNIFCKIWNREACKWVSCNNRMLNRYGCENLFPGSVHSLTTMELVCIICFWGRVCKK